MDWVRILAYITGTVGQELLLRNEYLAAENLILKAQLNTPLRLTDAERMTLAEIAHRLGIMPAPERKRTTTWRDFIRAHKAIVESGDVKTLPLPARSPNLYAFAERWVKSVKDECLSKLILFGEASLRRTLREYLVHYHVERNHQGKDNVLLFPAATKAMDHGDGSVNCKERLDGLLKYYHRESA